MTLINKHDDEKLKKCMVKGPYLYVHVNNHIGEGVG